MPFASNEWPITFNTHTHTRIVNRFLFGYPRAGLSDDEAEGESVIRCYMEWL